MVTLDHGDTKRLLSQINGDAEGFEQRRRGNDFRAAPNGDDFARHQHGQRTIHRLLNIMCGDDHAGAASQFVCDRLLIDFMCAGIQT